MTDIKTIVDEMLKEPIQHHFLDSGGEDGRMYQRNRKYGYLKGLNPVDEYTNGEERELQVTIPLFDFLTYNLISDEDTDKVSEILFTELEIRSVNPYHIFEVEDVIKELFDPTILAIRYVNTCNMEEYLSQTIQFCPFNYDGYDYIILQVHNRADVRGGYTYPQVFKVKDISYFWMGLFERKTECDCGLNDYYLRDDITDSSGWKIDKELIFDRTYVDSEGNVRCRDCDSIVKGGFIKW